MLLKSSTGCGQLDKVSSGGTAKGLLIWEDYSDLAAALLLPEPALHQGHLVAWILCGIALPQNTNP